MPDEDPTAPGTGGDRIRSPVETSRPNIARVYDYLLGGKDNFAADRELGDKIKEALPEVHLGVQQQRAALRRVVRYLVGEAGIRQLIDIGSGLPTAGNVHQVAQQTASGVRVVYVDNDPIVLAHARALMADNKATFVIDGDVRHPAEILSHPGLNELIDLGRPVALLLCGILHHILDEEDPVGITAGYRKALRSGSYVFIHHLVDIGDPGAAAVQAAFRQGMGRGQFRRLEQIKQFFDGLDFVDPGIVPVADWRPDADTPLTSDHPVLRLAVVGVARKP
ncbi:MAG TPA: SAM-dependent methyltransferase [Streptosporangiaceae bacterium]|nr:SAM-dependent methyltransferase [Streptosporangiaceae bacterium]